MDAGPVREGAERMADDRPPATGARGAAAPVAPVELRLRGLSGLAALLLMATASVPQPVDAAGRVRLVQRAAPQISVATTIVAQPASLIALPIQVGPPESLPSNSFVRLRGLPSSVSLTEGHAIGPGSWAVPLFALATLKANVPAGVSGRSEIIVNLVAVDGALLAEARTALVVGPAAMLAPPDPKRAGAMPTPPVAPVPAVRPGASQLSADDRTKAEKLVAQGERFLQQGSIVLAREFFRRAADVGLAQAAIRLAATYDPSEIARLGAQGVVPDRAEARKWYERARELGAPEAEERLARLGGS